MLSTKLKEAAGNSADATLYVDDVFSTYLYTGNGSTQTITNGIDLAGKGGLVWIKARSAAYSSALIDTARGATNSISSNSIGQQSTTTQLESFTASGYTGTEGSSYTNVSWTFRKAAKFFDVVTWTGDGSLNRDISHLLGIPPGMIVVKCTSEPSNWVVWHRSQDSNNCGLLNSSASFSSDNVSPAVGAAYGGNIYGSTTPLFTSTQFRVTLFDPANGTTTTGTNVNKTGATYVAYLFAHDTSSTGIIQCGSFTTNGSGAASINLGWEPQWLLVKSSSSLNQWTIVDSMRAFVTDGTTTGGNLRLYPNLSNAESNDSSQAPTATGFKYAGGATTSYIYMAIRMPNKPPTTGTQVYNANITNGIQVPAFVSGFPVDFAIRSNIAADQKITSTRLLGATAMNTVSTSQEGSEPPNKFDYMNGFYSTTFASNTIAWMFKRAPGFFDEVCWSGTKSGSGNETVAHNLGVVPELIIYKTRSTTSSWYTVSSFSSTQCSQSSMSINTTNLRTLANYADNDVIAAIPTSTIIKFGWPYSPSSQTNVAYLFATLAGISKVGSYTGNGTGQAIACGFSAGARFVLIKRTDATGGWYTFDSTRGLTSGSSPYLLLNSTAAETTGNNGVYASTGGFTLGSTASTTTNINAATYIFLAVA